jgi:hypothetical protein
MRMTTKDTMIQMRTTGGTGRPKVLPPIDDTFLSQFGTLPKTFPAFTRLALDIGARLQADCPPHKFLKTLPC